MLVKLLLASPDFMHLAQPSNRPDGDATRRLEDYLLRQPEAMILFSHNRHVLDRIVARISETTHDRITASFGSSESDEQPRQERHEQRQVEAYEQRKE